MRVTGLAKVVCYDFASLYRGSFWQLLFKQSFFRVNIAVATYTITLSFGFVFPQFTSSSFYVSFLSRVEMNSTNWPAPNAWVFIAQLAEHCSANAEVMGSNPVEVPNFFFRVNLQLLDLQLPMRNFEVFCRQKLQPGCELKWQHSIDDLGTLHMNPVDRAGPVSEISLHL